MSDFEAYSGEIDGGMEILEHFGILGQRKGVRNGPPYPLGRGEHSASEKKAAKAAGVKVGSDSGKGSIENVKKKTNTQNAVKKPKKELTEEEKREEALKAARSGDRKKIAKYMNYLTTNELQEAETRARVKSNITREDPNDRKASKAEMAKMEAIRSGNKEKIKQYADQMTYQELSEALNRVDLNRKLYPPPKSTMDKIQDVAKKVDQARSVAEKGINAYNLAAKVYNSTHKDGAQWPIIENKQNKENKKEEDVAKNLLSQFTKDVSKTVKEKSYEEQAKEKVERQKAEYTAQKEFNEWKNKQEAKDNKKTESNQTKEESNIFNLDNDTSNRKVNDYDGPSYDELIPDDVKDVWNRKVS